jgi:hypothetical protein
MNYNSANDIAEAAQEINQAISSDSEAPPKVRNAVVAGVRAVAGFFIDIKRIADAQETLAYVEHQRAKAEGIIK